MSRFSTARRLSTDQSAARGHLSKDVQTGKRESGLWAGVASGGKTRRKNDLQKGRTLSRATLLARFYRAEVRHSISSKRGGEAATMIGARLHSVTVFATLLRLTSCPCSGAAPPRPPTSATSNHGDNMAKDHRINLRLSETEYTKVKEKAGSQPLARWCREIALSEQGVRKRKAAVKTRYTAVDPALLKEINAIGNNLNQVARLGNAAQRRNSLELWQLTECLQLIREDLRELVKGVGSDARKNH